MSKRNPIMLITMKPTKNGWVIAFTRRTPSGGITFDNFMAKTFDAAVDRMSSTIMVDGYLPEDS